MPYNWHACRGTELSTTNYRITAHLLLLSTFPDLPAAKTLITTTIAVVFGAKVQEARRELGIVGKPRLFSEGAIALTYIVDEALDARSAVGDDGEVVGAMAELGELFFKLGLVEVDETGALRDGPRIQKVRAVLVQRGHAANSLVMKSLAIENILVVWLNFALSDEGMKAEVPNLAGDQCPPSKRRSRASLAQPQLTLRPTQVYAHCFWGAFSMVAPVKFPRLLERLWEKGAGNLFALAAASS